MSDWKLKKELQNLELEKMMEDDRNNWYKKIFAEMSGKSVTTQICLGAGAGWITGFTVGKIGKLAALFIGGSIILLEVANDQGLIRIDWSKVSKEVDKVTDKVETAVTGNKKSWIDKAERFVDRKLDAADDFLSDKRIKTKRWYTKFIGDETGVKINGLHIFMIAYCGGLSIGLATS